MFTKWIKRTVIVFVVLAVAGGFIFGRDLLSYVRSSAKMTQESVRNSIPVDFELQRAQVLLEEILPEIHANIQLIAKEEVELVGLKQEIEESEKALLLQKNRVNALKKALEENKESYQFAKRDYTRQEVADDLLAQFNNYKEAELVCQSKKKLYSTRENSLKSAMIMLEKTKSQKQLLASKIEGLESKHRLLKASAIENGVQIDNSKLAQTEKLLSQIKKRLDIAEKVMAHQSKFTQTIPVEELDADKLVDQVGEYFGDKSDSELTDIVEE